MKELSTLLCGNSPEIGDQYLIENIFSVISGFHQAAFLVEKIKQGMDGPVYYFQVDVFPEYFLLDSGFQQFAGDAEVPDAAWLGNVFIYFGMVFLEIVKEGRMYLHHLANGHFDDPEKGLNHVVRLIDQAVSLFIALQLVVVDHLGKQGILVLEAFIDGAFGYAQLFSQRVHGHASDAILPK